MKYSQYSNRTSLNSVLTAHLDSLGLSPPFLLRLMVGCFWKALSFWSAILTSAIVVLHERPCIQHRWQRLTQENAVSHSRIHFMELNKAERRGWLLPSWGEPVILYLRGMNLELWVAPIPGLPCFTWEHICGRVRWHENHLQWQQKTCIWGYHVVTPNTSHLIIGSLPKI